MEKYFQHIAFDESSQIIKCEYFRLTVITPRLIRIESGEYCDAATEKLPFTVLLRKYQYF